MRGCVRGGYIAERFMRDIKHLHKRNLNLRNTQYNYRNIRIKKIITIFALKDGTKVVLEKQYG